MGLKFPCWLLGAMPWVWEVHLSVVTQALHPRRVPGSGVATILASPLLWLLSWQLLWDLNLLRSQTCLGPIPKAPALSSIPFEFAHPQLSGSGFSSMTEKPKKEFLVRPCPIPPTGGEWKSSWCVDRILSVLAELA